MYNHCSIHRGQLAAEQADPCRAAEPQPAGDRPGPRPTAAMAAPAAGSDPLAGHPRYRKIKDINKGSFGFVVLAENVESENREQVAIKFTRVE